MKYVTIAMICAHTKKSNAAVNRALHMAGVEIHRFQGVKGIRIKATDANVFLRKQWPDVGPLPLPELNVEQ